MASIKRIDGKNGVRYQITVSCGYSVSGKKLFKTKTFKPDPYRTELQNKKELERVAYDFERAVISGEYMDGENMTLAEFIPKWLKEYAEIQLAPHTCEVYRDYLNTYVIPALGHFKIKAVKNAHIQKLCNHLYNDDVRRDGKSGGLSPATIRKIINIVSGIYTTAIKWEITDKNPCAHTSIPKPHYTAERTNYFTPEQAVIFLNALDEEYTNVFGERTRTDDGGHKYRIKGYSVPKTVPLRYKVFYHIAIYSGMRSGEILALTFDDIDFDNNVIDVSKSLSYTNHTLIIKSTKTKTSTRKVAIPPHVTALIKQLQREQKLNQLKIGELWNNPDQYIFTSEFGGHMVPSTPYQMFRKILRWHNDKISARKDISDNDKKRLLLPEITLHGLRHTSATLLISQSMDVKTVSARLGHAQTSTTMNIYAHALKSLDEKASEVLSNILHG